MGSHNFCALFAVFPCSQCPAMVNIIALHSVEVCIPESTRNRGLRCRRRRALARARCTQAGAGAGVGGRWCWRMLALAQVWALASAGVGAGSVAGAASSDDAGATTGDSFHAGSLSLFSTLGSSMDDGCGPKLEPRPVCEGEEPHANHLPDPSPPQVMPWACPCWP